MVLCRWNRQGSSPRLTGCGQCCRSEVCQIGQLVFAPGDDDPWIDGPCPALVFKKGRWRCELIMAEASAPVKKLIAKTLLVGMGCTCADSEEKMPL